MAGKTIAEKILSQHSGQDVHAGDVALCDVDAVMMHDANGPISVRVFRSMGGEKVFDPKKVTVIFDHCCPPSNEKLANIHAFMREFVREQGVNFYEGGRGVCHQIMVESGRVKAGDLVIGTDSHTCTYGALGALSTGLGATDVATVLKGGKLWFRVPETIRVNLNGELPPYCSAKDIILNVIGTLGADGGNYLSIEFYGEYLEKVSRAQHLTITNMVVEMGAKCGFTCHSGLGIAADADASYLKTVEIDLSTMEPAVAKPHTVDNVCPVTEVEGIEIQQAVLGSCTNGRLEDFETAARILGGKHVAEGVRLLILPASETILKQMAENGILSTLIAAGGIICTPGCGVCVGTLGGVPADGEVVISSTNRNFKGRMGNNKAMIYLASPETVAASALKGKISDPKKLPEFGGAGD
ncbi:MAG: 3-isopropylmalate dehydratase large subunit [Lachnospiraceae bacterium]|nr:3-isopropylmalate dehydratase large subunit [Lachnospiraceae bacterium]